MQKLYFIYKTINNKNGRYYIGAHETYNFNDGYLGSGKLIKEAIQKYGSEYFERHILEICSNRKDLYELEKKYVNEETLLDKNCYNVELGGNAPPLKKLGTKCKDKNSLIFDRMKNRNPSTLMKGNHHWSRNTVTVKDSFGNCSRVSKEDPRYVSGNLIPPNKGMITLKDKSGKIFYVEKTDKRFLSGELIHVTKGLSLTCPHCNKTGGNSMKRWHFDNCKKKGASVN